MANVNVNNSFLNNLKEMINKCCNSKCCDEEIVPPLPVTVSIEEHIKRSTPEINQGNSVIELGGSPS
jgi:hypothetical protein